MNRDLLAYQMASACFKNDYAAFARIYPADRKPDARTAFDEGRKLLERA